MSGQTKSTAEEVLANIRHGLRTPLNHIIGYGDLLLEDASVLEEESVARLKSVRANALLILEQIQHWLSPGESQTPREKIKALRSGIAEPLDLIIGNAGKLSQKLRGGALLDVLRIKVASRDLLAFVQGNEGNQDSTAIGKTRVHPSRSPDFRLRTVSLPSRLLVVDDDEVNCDVLQRLLVRNGHTVSCVGSGAEALDLLREPVFDLVLLDVVMPGLSGVQVLERLKASEILHRIPVIMMSALDEVEGAAHCIEMGAEDYLLKPFDPTLLRARLHSALDRKRLHEAEQERTAELELASESLKRANEDLNSFAFAASHDLQEPLRTITTTLQRLQLERDLAPEQHVLLERTIEGARRMSHLIRDLLVYSLPSSQERVLETVDSENSLEDALTNLRQSIGESGATVTHDPLPTILFDRAQLGRLFQNLIGNAIKYRSQKPPEICVTAANKDEQWVFSVRDNGIGIDQKYRRTIFEPFKRLHGHELPGTGLGLAICARIVEGSGGRIWVESEPGEGSAFFFTVRCNHGAPVAGGVERSRSGP
jgi:two-component system, sensor histidine kinase and response regulator